MTMTIASTTPASSGAVSSGTTPGTAHTAVAGSGFEGALVQAIGGATNTAKNSSGGLTLPIGLVSNLGLLGAESTEDSSQNLLDMLAKLIEQLQQLDKGDGEALPKEVVDQLAVLLAAFQGIMQQLGQSQPDLTGKQASIPESSWVGQTTDWLSSKPVLNDLLSTLQQLTTVLASNKDVIHAATVVAGQLETLLDSLSAQPSAAVQSKDVPTDNTNKTSTVIKTSDPATNGFTVPKEALNQAAAVHQETARPVQQLRNPIWRFNVVASEETASDGQTVLNGQTASNGQTAVVTSVTAAEESSDSSSQPAWTFMRNDSLASASADPASAKTALPTQVPVQQFAQQMGKFFVKQFLLTQGSGTSEAKLMLTPEHLGQVDIRIIMQNGQVTAHFMTDNTMARDLLDNQMSQLRASLQSQGLQVDRLEVVAQSSAASNTSFMQQEHRQPNSGNNGNSSNGRGKDGGYEDPALFAAELERTSFLRGIGYGSSLNVTA